MRWLPSHNIPVLPYDQIDWKLRYTFGKEGLHDLWIDMWFSGVAAGRIEGIVGTTLVLLILGMLALSVFVALRVSR